MKSVLVKDGLRQHEHGGSNTESMQDCLWCGSGLLRKGAQRFCCHDCCRLYNSPLFEDVDELYELLEVK
jgi:hypothetical protein